MRIWSLGYQGEHVGNPFLNTWTVSGGLITAFEFAGRANQNSAPEVTDSEISFYSSYFGPPSTSSFAWLYHPGLGVNISANQTWIDELSDLINLTFGYSRECREAPE